MTITASFFDHVKYPASEFLNRAKDLIGNGVINPATDFALSYPGGMAVNVTGAGKAWADGYRIGYDANPVQNLTIAAADPTNPRIDLIEIGYSGTGTAGIGQFKVVTGVAQVSPIQPSPDAGYVVLYAVNVAANATAIAAGNVTDLRKHITVGGIDPTGHQHTGVAGDAPQIPTAGLKNPPMFSFPNLLHPSDQQFTRGSNASRKNLAPVPYNVLRYEQGKFGLGAFIEEATTNLVYNSDFETITGTAQLFNDPMTSGTAWTIRAGGFTYSASGATSTAVGSSFTAGNPNWKPLNGSNGASLSLTAQATFTMPTTVPAGAIILKLFVDGSNFYQVNSDGATLSLLKVVGGTQTVLSTIAQALSANTSYTVTLAIDPSGHLTAKLYSGVGTGGTLLQTLTATDTSLSGGYLINLSADTGVVIKNALVSAPFADGWLIGGDTRAAWALTATNPISGTYSISVVGAASVQGNIQSVLSGINNSQSYTWSMYASTQSLGAGGAYLNFYVPTTTIVSINTPTITGTTVLQRYTATTTVPASGSTSGSHIAIGINDAGTAVFDAIQIEAKSYPTTYVRNDSTTATASRSADTLQYNLTQPLPVRWFNAYIWTPSYSSSALSGRDYIIAQINNSSGSLRYKLLYRQSDNKFHFIKSPDGTTLYDNASSAITFSAGNNISIFTLDDPVTAGNTQLFVGVNSGTLTQFTLANTNQITDAQVSYVGCGSSTGNECDGVIDYPIASATIPTTEQINALYYSAEWGGVRDYPGALPDKVIIGDSRAKLSRGKEGIIQLSNSQFGSNLVLSGNTSTCYNCYWDEVAGQWNRYDTTKPAFMIVTTNPPQIDYVSAGANPISWTGYNILQALSGGYKVQSGHTSISITTAGSQASVAVTFPTAYAVGTAPEVIPGVSGATSLGNWIDISALGISNTGFSLVVNSGIINDLTISWVAIGS